MKVFWILILLIIAHVSLHAQTVYDQYLKFNEHLFEGDKATAFTLGEQILASNEKLPAKTETKFNNFMAGLYENNNQPDKAIALYEKVIAAEPDFEVAHRALGALYLHQSNLAVGKIPAGRDNIAAYNAAVANYVSLVKKSLVHLEKSQACEPSVAGLAQIKSLLTKINDKAGLASLNARLKTLSQHCLDLLTD
jgi:tetratricopeptide (TPR) repeat protein